MSKAKIYSVIKESIDWLCLLLFIGMCVYGFFNLSLRMKFLENSIEIYRDAIYNKVDTLLGKIILQDLPNAKNILEANVFIVNATKGFCGSGTHIKLAGKSYILTASHLMSAEDDELFFTDQVHKNKKYFLKLEKINRFYDLALFSVMGEQPTIASLELSDKGPEVGSSVVVIGNPGDMVDIVSNGVISKLKGLRYTFTNIIYEGNSGGVLLYKGKIVGVVTNGCILAKLPILAQYGEAIKLKFIRIFLKSYLE